MRCPYCGGINSDRTDYCIHCGRTISESQPPNSPSRQPSQPTGYPPSVRPGQPPRQVPRPVSQPPVQNPARVRQPEVPVAPSAPEPPAPFPPRTLAHLQALESGALSYTVMDTTVGDGRKKMVRISYPKCVAWQQVATLLKAFNEQQEERFDSIIIQGVFTQDPGVYAFTNGQLHFDRNVRLGSQITHRYQIETGNGFASDSIRIVLTE